MRLINRLFLALLSCALSVGVFAQTQDSTVVAAKDSVAPKKTKVFLEHANTLSFDKERNAEAQVLNGDVCFRHDSSYMYCDSAYFFEQTNSLEAFSNVRMEQGDTLFVYGNYLLIDKKGRPSLRKRKKLCRDVWGRVNVTSSYIKLSTIV